MRNSSIETVFEHINGQVEIDCLLLGKRKGKDILFVFEAKKDGIHKSISKHKLAYPILAISNNIPEDIEIVPVYLKVTTTNSGIFYYISECYPMDPRKNIISVNDIIPQSSKIFKLEIKHPINSL